MPDSSSFDAFFRTTFDRTFRYLYAVLGDRAEAQDVAQEAYGRAWRRWDEVQAMADPEAWVRTVGWRVGANHLRHLRVAARWRVQQTATPTEREPGLDSVVLVVALEQIHPEQRRALVLHYLLDMPVAQVAAETGVSVSAAKARLVRGRQALSDLLATTEETADA